MTTSPTRRAFLSRAALAGAAFPFAAPPADARAGRNFSFDYDVTRTEAEWRARLTDFEYAILREGGTEWAKTSDWWDDYRDGKFTCKGCDLLVYTSKWRVELDKGWVFFSNAEPVAIMTDIDERASYSMSGAQAATLIECHCRRCGSHLGHILTVEGKTVHCINGYALNFEPETA